MPLLVTRAAEDCDALVAWLHSTGVDARATPCLAYESIALPADCLDRWRGGPLVIGLSSPRAVPAAFALNLAPEWRVHALAPATARVAERAGLRVDLAVPGGGRELAASAEQLPFVLLGSQLAGAEVRAVRPNVTCIVAYRTIAPASINLPEGPFDLLFCSPSAIENFVNLAPGGFARARTVYCHGRTTAEAAERVGCRPTPYTLPSSLDETSSPPSPY